ncbi:DUF4280 domain-containing protein [Tenacibaculum sp. Ill]|uniref:DUF4280 domain-containing protein n=1 Tax=Tenacibaculum sp. Ill TaxID=3445935 RepID=UPI003F79CAB1
MSDVAVICNGAMCKCAHGFTPDTFAVVSTHKHYINESSGSQKMVGSTMDIGQPFEAKTFGQCKLQPSGSSYLPCMPSIIQWQDFYEKVTLSNQGKILTEKSKAICAIAGAPCVEFTFHGQVGAPTESQAAQTNTAVHSQMNPLANPKQAIEDTDDTDLLEIK